jgi:hypothetical protein
MLAKESSIIFSVKRSILFCNKKCGNPTGKSALYFGVKIELI